jgi:hypothetical protein
VPVFNARLNCYTMQAHIHQPIVELLRAFEGRSDKLMPLIGFLESHGFSHEESVSLCEATERIHQRTAEIKRSGFEPVHAVRESARKLEVTSDGCMWETARLEHPSIDSNSDAAVLIRKGPEPESAGREIHGKALFVVQQNLDEWETVFGQGPLGGEVFPSMVRSFQDPLGSATWATSEIWAGFLEGLLGLGLSGMG